MREHNNLYYIFLWDSQKIKLPSDRVEQIKKILIALML